MHSSRIYSFKKANYFYLKYIYIYIYVHRYREKYNLIYV